jgi:hypothetical protein
MMWNVTTCGALVEHQKAFGINAVPNVPYVPHTLGRKALQCGPLLYLNPMPCCGTWNTKQKNFCNLSYAHMRSENWSYPPNRYKHFNRFPSAASCCLAVLLCKLPGLRKCQSGSRFAVFWHTTFTSTPSPPALLLGALPGRL